MLERLGIELDRDAEVPLGVQLAWALRARIHDGRLGSGERLPALRDLAEGLGVNANTIRAVYQRLEHEGLLASLQGSGTFVTAGPRERSAAGAIAEVAAREARATGVDPREVAAALYVAQGSPTQRERPENGSAKATGSRSALSRPESMREDLSQADRRRQLRTRIAALEQMLAELEVRHPGLARAARSGAPRGGAGPRLLDTAELEQVQTELLRRIAAIQTAIDDHARDGAGGEGGEPPEPAPTVKPKVAPATKRRAASVVKPKARPRSIPRPATTGG
ncbi:MAG TPA: GntR family transcriptional regulator [Solirubrobacteraceae bacterium]|jgi:DNA-binding transcriptional regulator YhcF (GntR family)|nr:GntR family transcriptional regulator [Solirubrobacteraceae bacterium]